MRCGLGLVTARSAAVRLCAECGAACVSRPPWRVRSPAQFQDSDADGTTGVRLSKELMKVAAEVTSPRARAGVDGAMHAAACGAPRRR